ncbi:MAG: hypothetical protein HOV80_28990, partial [Polyangiaceae bacterium]|nr:hypothetical protein [Polyangiaceae bacterium]
MSDFVYEPILNLGVGPEEAPPSFRLLTKDFVSTFQAAGSTFLKVEPEGLTM